MVVFPIRTGIGRCYYIHRKMFKYTIFELIYRTDPLCHCRIRVDGKIYLVNDVL